MEHINGTIGHKGAVRPPAPLLELLETSIPGVSLLTRFLSEYLHIDLSQYIGLALLIVGITAVGHTYVDKIRATWSNFFMSSVEIRYNDEIYNYLMFWISKGELSTRSRHIIAGTQTNSSDVYINEDTEGKENEPELEESDIDKTEQAQNWDRMKKLRFTPSTGTHWFRYRGSWMMFTRTQEEKRSLWGSVAAETISISCFGWNAQILKDLLQEAQLAYLERDGNKTIIYRGIKQWSGSIDPMDWIRCMSRSPRQMSTVVLDESQKQLILDDMREYLHPQTVSLVYPVLMTIS
jgi:chaperone BCS1